MAERDTGLLAPLEIKKKAEAYARDLRKQEDTNYDEVDNKYDAIRHIGGSLALYSQYPDTASDIILNAKEYIFSAGDERGREMDLHNNAIGKKLYEMMDEEQRNNLTTEQALEIARSYVEELEMSDSENTDLPEDMKPKIIYGKTKEPAKMNEGGLMGDPMSAKELASNLDSRFVDRVFKYADEREPLENPELERMNTLLDAAFRGLFNNQMTPSGGSLREAYSNRVREIRNMNPELFDSYFLARNTEQKADALNVEAFSDNPAAYMQEEADEAPYVLNIPFGSEDEYTLGGATGLRGWARPAEQFGDREIFVAGESGEDEGAKRSGVVRHEIRHLKTREAPMPVPYRNEDLMRQFDALSAVLSQDSEKVEDIFDLEYGAKVLKNPEMRSTYERYFRNDFLSRVQNAVEALPKLYEAGVYNREKIDEKKLQQFLNDFDKDNQGMIDYLLGQDPEKQEDVKAKIDTSLDDASELAKAISVAPFVKEVESRGSGSTARVEYDIDREKAEEQMNSGGLMKNEYNRGGDVIKTEAGEKMKKENPNKALPEKADINKDGEFQEWEKARHEAIKAAQAEDSAEMNMGGLMSDHPMMKMVVGIEKESGNEIPPGSMPEEVADDIPAMLSEGEYVVPADVVRWHGVKTFEELRCEAKMGMGLMAHDGRIAEVDEETRLPVDSDIEEDDKPDVEKAKVKVIEANEGALVTPQAPFYRYESRLNPETNRYEFVPVDPITGVTITDEEFNQAQSTRYTPQTVLGLDEEQAIPECPDGFEYDEEVGACMPIERAVPRSVVSPDDGGDGPQDVTGGRVDYASQGLTQLAEALGPLSAEDLADYEGDTLAQQAVSRMTTEATPVSMTGGLLGLGISAVQNISDNVGARRAAITRANEFTADPLGIQAYNFNFDPDTGSFKQTSPTTQVTQTQERAGGGSWVTDYNNVGASGREYSSDDLFGGDYDPDDPNDPVNDVFAGIENDFANMTAVTGGGSRNMYGSDDGGRDDRGGVSAAESQAAADTYGTTAGSQQSDMLAEQDRGLRDDDDSGDDGDDGGKIVCTAMNNAYGFGSFRQTIWLKHSANMSPEYEVGYHTLFQPLVDYAYKTEKVGHKTLRKMLEHIARRRTADIWKQRHGKRDVIGAVERAVLEPLCYVTGYIKTRIK